MGDPKLDETKIRQLAKLLDVSPAAVLRIAGSVTVAMEDGSEKPSRVFDLGLRLLSLDCATSHLPQLEEQLKLALIEYRRTCPAIFLWMVRGDFHPKKLPTEIQQGKLLHACRTAGRLRARVLRNIPKIPDYF